VTTRSKTAETASLNNVSTNQLIIRMKLRSETFLNIKKDMENSVYCPAHNLTLHKLYSGNSVIK